MSPVDMSAEGVTLRLKTVAELRNVCLVLGRAKVIRTAAEKANDPSGAKERERTPPPEEAAGST
jgi:hypothetical protein